MTMPFPSLITYINFYIQNYSTNFIFSQKFFKKNLYKDEKCKMNIFIIDINLFLCYTNTRKQKARQYKRAATLSYLRR